MKRNLFVVFMLAGSVLLLSASGKKDDDNQFYGRGPGMMGGYGYSAEDSAKLQEQREADRQAYLDTLETVSVTGSLSLVDGQLPVIEQNGSQYVIMAPWNDLAELNLKDGMTITVEGYKMPGRPLQWDDKDIYVMATKAVIDGKDYEVDHDMNGYGMMGPGMMGGPAGRPMGGPGGQRGGRGGMMGPRF